MPDSSRNTPYPPPNPVPPFLAQPLEIDAAEQDGDTAPGTAKRGFLARTGTVLAAMVVVLFLGGTLFGIGLYGSPASSDPGAGAEMQVAESMPMPPPLPPLSEPVAEEAPPASAPATPDSSEPPPPAAERPADAGSHVIRVGVFSRQEIAADWAGRMEKEGLPVLLEKRQGKERDLSFLFAGPFADEAAAKAALPRVISATGAKDAHVAPR